MRQTNYDPVRAVPDALRQRGCEPKQTGGEHQWEARCPAHEDGKASLAVSVGSAGRVLLHCYAGCPTEKVVEALGLRMADLFPKRASKQGGSDSHAPRGQIVAVYDYLDTFHKLVSQVVRFEPKGFTQRRPDGKGHWVWGLDKAEYVRNSVGDWSKVRASTPANAERRQFPATPRILYRLPELLAADPNEWVFVVEGEKDADNLRAVSLVATCNLGGAGKWKLVDDDPLTGRRVAIIPDRDKPDPKTGRVAGADHGQDVARRLHGKAREVRLVELPGDGVKDASDWLAAHDAQTPDELRAALLAMIEAAPPWEPPKKLDAPDAGSKGAGAPDLASCLLDEHRTDLGNARRLVVKHGRDLRFCHPWHKWLVWNGRRWAQDGTGGAMRWMKDTVLDLLQEASDRNLPDEERQKLVSFAMSSQSEAKLRAALKVAETEQAVAVGADGFDCDPWAFNCLNGTLDLRTGELRPHDRADMLTKLAPVEYHPDARLDMWDRFLATTTGGDRDLASFLCRVAGYSLTGDTGEEKLFFVYGPAATGKSTFLEALKAAWGDYAQTMDFETLLARPQVGGIRNDVASLAGARLAGSVEVEEGKRLAEGLVKLITGGDRVRSRFLYQESFEFIPQCKLWLAANHAPKVRNDDLAIWRRILRIPFEHTIPEGQRDPAFKATLRDPTKAGPAILAWAVRGCLEWQRDGLRVPDAVTRSTDAYRDEVDPIADFIETCCELAQPQMRDLYRVTAKQLRAAYICWTKEAGCRPLGPQHFASALREHGAEDGWDGSSRAWKGLRLRPEALPLAMN
ncbi:MAG: hypothetical protein FJ290_24050 [Planctomycetes bacterium]|nr:hypothetical protein [Planctomycetota bacterium]